MEIQRMGAIITEKPRAHRELETRAVSGLRSKATIAERQVLAV